MRRDRPGNFRGGFSCLELVSEPDSKVATTDLYLTDDLAERLAQYADRSVEALDLLGTLRDGWNRADAAGKRPRVAVRGLTGSARAYLVSWIQRRTDRPLLYVVPHGEAFEAA